MKSIIIVSMVALGLGAAGSVRASEEMAKKSGCLMCHAVADKKVGPAFKDIAAGNKGKAGAPAAIAAKLKEGKGHPPVKAGDDDLKKILAWVLSR